MECSTPPRSGKFSSFDSSPTGTAKTSPESTSSSPMPRTLSIQAAQMLNSNSVGSMWSVEIASLRHAGSHYEAVQCIRRVKILLGEVDLADRTKYCKPDYDAAVKALRKQKHVWSLDLFKETVAVTIQFFSANQFQKLPVSVFIEIMAMFPVEELAPLMCVSEEWRELCTCNEAWSAFYRRKFLLNNPGRLPTDESRLINSYRQRLLDPQIGDKVEVAWRGKFRLETSDVYQGLAWWVAEVVDKHPAQGRYKIRYPGWDNRWDEWVPRARLRWKVARNTIVRLDANDTVELWCCGANVPGAWLECKIRKVRNGRYSLSRVVANGHLWVGRERLRLVKKHAVLLGPGQSDSGRNTDTGGSQRSLLGSWMSSVSRSFRGFFMGSATPSVVPVEGDTEEAAAGAAAASSGTGDTGANADAAAAASNDNDQEEYPDEAPQQDHDAPACTIM